MMVLFIPAGNHEIELDSYGKSFQAYKTRYPNVGMLGSRGSTFAYYSTEHGGVHSIFLTPYLDSSPDSPQYNWCAQPHL